MNGGWAQLPTLESDAYATGQALYTLARFVKDPLTDPVWQRGLRFLLESQGIDGTWHGERFPFSLRRIAASRTTAIRGSRLRPQAGRCWR
jgi:hypothetical protein